MDFIAFQTYIVYLSLAACMISLCWMSAREKNNWWMVAAVTIYSLVFAVRYNVGVDMPQYLKTYLSACNGLIDFNLERWEPLFKWVSMMLVKSDAPHTVFFFVWAFAPLMCVFWSIRQYKDVYPYLAFTFMFGAIWLSYANGLRQIMAFGFFALAVPYLFEKKLWKYLILVLLATLSHKSAAILVILPIFYFRRKTYFNNRMVQLIALAVALALMNINMVQELWTQFDVLINYFEYQYYQKSQFMKMAKFDLGVGFYINLLINVILIIYSNVTKRQFPKSIVGVIYDFTFIGMILNYAFLRIQLIGRINYYFYGFNYIVAAFTLLALMRERKQFALISLIALYVLVFIATLYRMEENTSMFRFYWEVFRL